MDESTPSEQRNSSPGATVRRCAWKGLRRVVGVITNSRSWQSHLRHKTVIEVDSCIPWWKCEGSCIRDHGREKSGRAAGGHTLVHEGAGQVELN